MSSFTTTLTTILTITTLIGVALAGLQRGVVGNLRESNSDLRNRAEDLEKRAKEAEEARDRAKADLDAMTRVVTGEAYLVALIDTTNEHHEEAKAYWRNNQSVLHEVLQNIQKLANGTDRL